MKITQPRASETMSKLHYIEIPSNKLTQFIHYTCDSKLLDNQIWVVLLMVIIHLDYEGGSILHKYIKHHLL